MGGSQLLSSQGQTSHMAKIQETPPLPLSQLCSFSSESWLLASCFSLILMKWQWKSKLEERRATGDNLGFILSLFWYESSLVKGKGLSLRSYPQILLFSPIGFGLSSLQSRRYKLPIPLTLSQESPEKCLSSWLEHLNSVYIYNKV